MVTWLVGWQVHADQGQGQEGDEGAYRGGNAGPEG